MNMRRHGFADSLQPGDSPVDRRVSSCAGVAERVPRGALVLSSIACCLAFQSIAHGGSGFELRSQSAMTLGSAQAGMTAAAEDISYIAFNPAALGKGEGMQFAIGATGLLTSVRMSHPMASTA